MIKQCLLPVTAAKNKWFMILTKQAYFMIFFLFQPCKGLYNIYAFVYISSRGSKVKLFMASLSLTAEAGNESGLKNHVSDY